MHFFCLLFLISITLFITLSFLSASPLSHQFNGGVLSKAFHRWFPWARTQPHCPWSNYSKKERTFLLFFAGAFPWLPSSPAVKSSSAQLLLHSELAMERKRPAETWWVPAHYQHRMSDLLQAQKTHNLFSLLPTWLDIRQDVIPWRLRSSTTQTL